MRVPLFLSVLLAVSLGCQGSSPVGGGSVRCGDGVVSAREACDDGPDNSDTAPDACRTDCTRARCGDGVVDRNEGCDDGPENGPEPARCGLDCRVHGCGNGYLDPGEECDRGAENSDTLPDACRTTCRLPACGDGVVDRGESCDGGTENSDTAADACRTDCTLPRCGDGVVDTGEGCDDGPANGDPPATCRGTCRLASCGDGLVDPGEECDDGDRNSDVEPGACRLACLRARCGDAVIDPGELCDDGAANSAIAPDACRPTCVPSHCGDGVVDADEDCDEGDDNSDTAPGACRLDCREARCGDGVVDPPESCDDGPFNDDTRPGACRTTCMAAGCGDGVVDPGEQCDFGAAGGPDDCSAACTWEVPASCGPRAPVLDLRAVGTPFGTSGWRVQHDSTNDPEAIATACGGYGQETWFGMVVDRYGDLAVEVVPGPALSARAVIEVRRSCDEPLACVAVPEGAPSQIARLLVPGLDPGVYLIHVDWDPTGGGPFEVRAALHPPLGAGEPCDTDGGRGRCLADEPLACVEPISDGDGIGVCVEAVPPGSGCGDTAACATGAECFLATETTGVCAAACGNGRIDPLEECDDGNLQDGDGCSAECRIAGHTCGDAFDLTSRWDPVTRRGSWSLPGAVFLPSPRSSCDPAINLGRAWARFTAPAEGTYRFVLVPTTIGALELVTGCAPGGASLGCASGGYGWPRSSTRTLAAGETVWLVAESDGPAELFVYQGHCGDGRVDPDETCDDGNGTDAGPCPANCRQLGDTCATAATLTPDANGVAIWRGSTIGLLSDLRSPQCSPMQGGDAVASFRAPFAGAYEIVRRGRANVPSVYLADACHPAPSACIGGSVAGTASLRYELAANQQVWIVVGGGNKYSLLFELEVRPIRCGDGWRSPGEECDDGNTGAGDGCDSTCRAEAQELEPNDGPPQANPLPLGTWMRGELEYDRVDSFSFHAVATGRYTVEVVRTDAVDCARRPDLTVELLDAAGHVLASSVADPSGCPRLSWRAPATGEYRVVLSDRGGGPLRKAYTLRVTSP